LTRIVLVEVVNQSEKVSVHSKAILIDSLLVLEAFQHVFKNGSLNRSLKKLQEIATTRRDKLELSLIWRH
jgi:hypothetical protein